MKRFEVTITANGIRVLNENPYPMSAWQKFAIVMTLIGAVVILGFFRMVT